MNINQLNPNNITNHELETGIKLQGQIKEKREAVDVIGKILMHMKDTDAYDVRIMVRCEYHNDNSGTLNATNHMPNELKHALEHAQIRLRNEILDLEKEFTLL